ncbi:glycoprotein-N-acetylgalactosamine 3-beta-galactosyltransferase 1-like isoform X2 [Dreissena polymorpha]|uniref:glycoprotein-N-acetylgalactosamine 3-beta-galactosyltransferase 1-like isoform X2 n=1 Tax=Dreissena polymorpha TaxID=45954 RepID=UPI002264C20E|nr:glycoprotein-N-acetylgalactosamine 3-beta-galactosyltransferase 1-like isoform X2 [Dreissena polymorpha]
MKEEIDFSTMRKLSLLGSSRKCSGFGRLMSEISEYFARFRQIKVHVRTLFLVLACSVITLLYLTHGVTNSFAGLSVSAGSVVQRNGHIRVENETVSRRKLDKSYIDEVKRVRLLCIILTMEKDIPTKVAAVNQTWASRCDIHFYVLNSKIRKSDFLNINDVPDDRFHLVHKIQEVYKIIHKLYLNDFDYVLKADDDTYIVVENLKFLLWHYNSSEPGYLGFHFNKFVSSGYMSGGAGYVISNRGLRNMIERGYNGGLCLIVKHNDDPENSEDIETGRCLEASGVPVLSSLDVEGRETFHPYQLEKHLFGNLPGYIYSWAKNPIEKGARCCAKYVISFHYMTPDAILFVDHLLYYTDVFSKHLNGENTLPAFKIERVK